MPVPSLIFLVSAASDAINKALESGAMVESPELKMHIASLLEQLSLMRGDLGMGAKNKKNPVEEARVG